MLNALNLPLFEFRIEERAGASFVWDRLRRRFVKWTPEEYVRQTFVYYLIEHLHFPEALMANEVEIRLGKVKKRCDTLVYDRTMNPLVLLEFKAPNVAIDSSVFDQLVRYNMVLGVRFLVVSNGMQHYCCLIDRDLETYHFLEQVPDYSSLMKLLI